MSTVNVIEEWRTVPNFEGYQVSSLGRIRSLDRIVKCKNGDRMYHGKPMTTNMLGPYEFIHFRHKLRISVHGLVALVFIGPRPEKMEVNHINGNKRDNRAVNLEYTTASGNAIHAFKMGLRVPTNGERNGQARLTTQDVIEIRKSREVNRKVLADKYGVSKRQIRAILSGRRWGHVA